MAQGPSIYQFAHVAKAELPLNNVVVNLCLTPFCQQHAAYSYGTARCSGLHEFKGLQSHARGAEELEDETVTYIQGCPKMSFKSLKLFYGFSTLFVVAVILNER